MKIFILGRSNTYIFVALLVLFTLTCPKLTWSGEEGPGHGGGAEYTENLEITLKYWIESGWLKSALINYIKTIELDKIDTSVPDNQIIKSTFERMLANGQLEVDIQTLNIYELGENCRDAYDKKVSASTLIGEKGAKICFDKDILLTEFKYIPTEEVMIRFASLALHEHTHHFQVKSQDPEKIKNNENEAYLISAYVQSSAISTKMPILKWAPPKVYGELGAGIWSNLPNDYIGIQVEGDTRLKRWGCDHFDNCYNLPLPQDVDNLIIEFEKKRPALRNNFYEIINNGIYKNEFHRYEEIANIFEARYGKNNRLSGLYRDFIKPKCDRDLVFQIVKDTFDENSKHISFLGDFSRVSIYDKISSVLDENSYLTKELIALRDQLTLMYVRENPEAFSKKYLEFIHWSSLRNGLLTLNLIRRSLKSLTNWKPVYFFNDVGGHIENADIHNCLFRRNLISYLNIDQKCMGFTKEKRDGGREGVQIPLLYQKDIEGVIEKVGQEYFQKNYRIDPVRDQELLEKILLGGSGNTPLRIKCNTPENGLWTILATLGKIELQGEDHYQFDFKSHEVTVTPWLPRLFFSIPRFIESLDVSNFYRGVGGKKQKD